MNIHLAIYDINIFTDCNKYLYFSFKQMIIEIAVLSLDCVFLSQILFYRKLYSINLKCILKMKRSILQMEIVMRSLHPARVMNLKTKSKYS